MDDEPILPKSNKQKERASATYDAGYEKARTLNDNVYEKNMFSMKEVKL